MGAKTTTQVPRSQNSTNNTADWVAAYSGTSRGRGSRSRRKMQNGAAALLHLPARSAVPSFTVLHNALPKLSHAPPGISRRTAVGAASVTRCLCSLLPYLHRVSLFLSCVGHGSSLPTPARTAARQRSRPLQQLAARGTPRRMGPSTGCIGAGRHDF